MTWNWMRNLEEAFILLSATLVSETTIHLLEEVSYGSTEVCCEDVMVLCRVGVLPFNGFSFLFVPALSAIKS